MTPRQQTIPVLLVELRAVPVGALSKLLCTGDCNCDHKTAIIELVPLLLERAQVLHQRLDAAETAQPVRHAVDDRPVHAAVFRRDGDYWSIGCRGTTVRLKDSKGLQYLWYLVSHPGEEFLALDLVARSRDQDMTVAPQLHATGLAALDATSKAAYRQRLAELRESLREAESLNDRGAAERAQTEIQFLEDELAAAIGLGGRDRSTGSSTERARSTVTKGIKSAVSKLSATNRSLARHFDRSVRTGVFCAYAPDPDDQPSWQL